MKLFIKSALSILVLCALAAAQAPKNATETDKPSPALENALKLLQEVVDEAQSLRLWENRALVYASAGDMLWETDRKNAAKLFKSAESELMNGVMVEVSKSTDFAEQFTSRSNFSSRRIVLLSIAGRDGALALEILYRTRPVNVQNAIDRSNLPKVEGVEKSQIEVENEQRDKRFVTEETSLEQSIAKLSIEQDPAKAAKLIRSSLEKGVSYESVDLLKKIYAVDTKLAEEIFSDVLNKLLGADYSDQNATELYAAQGVLIEADKALNSSKSAKQIFPTAEKRDLTSLSNKIADAYLARKNLYSFWGFSAVVSVLKKYSPSKAAALTAKSEEILKDGPDYLKASMRADEYMKDEKKTPADLVAAARDFSQWQKSQLLDKAVERSETRSSLMDLRSMLKSEQPDEQRDNALGKIDAKLAKLAITDGDMDAVRELIDTAENDDTKLKLIINLAAEFQKQNTEEGHKSALNLLNDATRYVGRTPQDGKEADNMLLIASGFAQVDPEEAFPYLEGLTTMANDLLLAESLRAKYDKRSAKFIEGEVIFSQHVPNSYASYGPQLRLLTEADFESVLKVIDRFERDDIKTLLRLLAVQSVLKEKIGFEGNRVASYTIFSTS